MIIVTSRGPTVSDIVTITASGGLTVTHDIMRIVSDGGSVNITANPQISPGNRDGQSLKIIGTSDPDQVIFDPGDGLSMSESVISGDKDTLAFLWSTDENLWVMETSDTK